MTDTAHTSIADLGPIDRRRQQRAWNWYDWANSAYYTTVLSVLFAPYMITVAGKAAGCANADDTCSRTVSVLGLHLAAGSLPFYLTSFAILVDISTEDERDDVSSRGWAFGYLGGGLLLAINLGMFLGHDAIGLGKGMAVRLSLLSAALWWAGFTLIPLIRLHNHAPVNLVAAEGSLFQRSFGQLFATLRDLRTYPMTLTFLLAYVFYNDGIQTVIYAASTYGTKQLKFSSSVLIATILLIQFVAFGGALFFGRLAARVGSYRSILWGTYAWMVIVAGAIFLPAKNAPLFYLLAVAIGIVLGGTQALSRSFFSLLIPRGREGEYFSLYNAAERGTSWFGTLLFGVVFQIAGSYRPAILALIVFFVLGAFFLTRLDPKRGIEEAGNTVPVRV
jgi:UMF1 family MFS transporter